MDRAVFEIKMHPVGRLYFIFKDSTGVSRITSKSFISRASLERCIAGVRETAPVAEIVIEPSEYLVLPRLQIQERANGFSFDLIGYMGEIIFSSTQFADADACLDAVRLFKRESPDAGLLDSICC